MPGTRLRYAIALSLGVALAGAAASAQAPAGGVDTHVAAARAAAGQDFVPLFNRLCTAPAPAPPAATGAAAAPAPQGPPPRAQWYVEPVKVFDNLYFVGEKDYTAWAVMTSDGIIVIDPIYDYSVEDEVVKGLTTLGADPKRIRYVVVSHAHRDHVGGARLLQERFKARVLMAAADWDLLERTGGDWPKPTRDMTITDGQRLTLGDTTLTFHTTPGHTLGTVSTILPVKDGGRTHQAALWGGTAFNWTANPRQYITPERPARFWFDSYIASARKFRDVAAKAGADVVISNHSDFDGSKTKIPALASRKPGDRHPYVVGSASVARYFTLAEECAQAGLRRLSS
jgi:metallo-beta-lactamase class B